jgi:hypothetical protein
MDERDALDGVVSKAEYSCSQCAEWASSIDIMSFAGNCMMGASASCCGSVASFGVEPCVHTLMEGMPAAFVPMMQDILSGCALTLAPKCGSATVEVPSRQRVVPDEERDVRDDSSSREERTREESVPAPPLLSDLVITKYDDFYRCVAGSHRHSCSFSLRMPFITRHLHNVHSAVTRTAWSVARAQGASVLLPCLFVPFCISDLYLMHV